jgi:PmbA protein
MISNHESDLQNTVEKLVDFARKNGADQVQISIGSGEEFTVEVLNKEIEKLTQAGSLGLGMKIIVDNKVATASTNDMDEDSLLGMVLRTLERAKLSNMDVFSGLPESVSEIPDIDLLLFDDKIDDLTPEYKINFALELERVCLLDKRIVLSVGSYYSTQKSEHYLANSKGFSGSYKRSSCSSGIHLQAGDNNEKFEDGWFSTAINPDDMQSVESISAKAVERAVRLIGARKIDSQIVPVIFEPGVTSSLLAFLSGTINGHSIYMNRSLFKDKLGEKIAADIVNIKSDGLLPGKFGSKLFDAEGVASRNIDVIENGVLKSYLLDTYSARKLDMQSTGNASGSNNFYLCPGNNSLEAMIKSIDNGILITKLIGQGTNPVTGDISKGAFGLMIENGEISYPVHEITISGNLAVILKNFEMIGNDFEWNRTIVGPSIKISELSISGK